MRKRTVGILVILVTGVVLLAAVSVASGSASATKYTAKLTAGQEVPKGVGVPAGATIVDPASGKTVAAVTPLRCAIQVARRIQ